MVKKLKKILILILTLSLFSCSQYTTIDTTDYTITLPESYTNTRNIDDNSSEFSSSSSENNFTVWIIKKNKYDFPKNNELKSCIANELDMFIGGKNYGNINKKEQIINGVKATIISGVSYTEKNRKTYWTSAIFQTKYYFYIVRVWSYGKKKSANEAENLRIINSFYIKNND